MRGRSLLLLLTACKARLGGGMDDAGPGGVDGMPLAVDAALDAAPLPPWGPPTPVAITAASDDDPSATADLLELYFNRASDIYVVKRGSLAGVWGMPTAVTELNTSAAETTPEVSYDGLTIYFASARTPTLGGNDIWMATRASRTLAWSAPVHVPALSSSANDGAPVTTDPLVVAIDSERAGSVDLFVATRASAGATWGMPAALGELNSAQSDGNPMIVGDGRTIYFDSARTGNGELYVATRSAPTGAFDPPARIIELSSTATDNDPWISPDGRTMFFASNRDGTLRLWQTTR